ncbi:MAG: protein kinase [Labilithrix sp.]|nr:protein kinase [Labilithrix sp.]MCW5812919.1 protein kinase [Labilithrix sp.]
MAEDRTFIESLKGMRIGGRYVVEKVLGAGGMGVVATAKYPELQQRVAIKFLRPEHASNEILHARFVREARLAARVKSEHFVRVFDIGKLPTGVPYLVMELLSGHDLADELVANGKMKVETALEWVLQACAGIAEVHALGVVHRDLKPSNLFIAEAAGKRLLKVLDFGISKESSAKVDGAPLTSTDNLLGTPQYMSPEQVRASKDVDARSDIWALGVILYETLTGKRPFVSDENATGELFAKVLYIDPALPREHEPSLPVELEAVIMKCLARDRGERYADVAALAEALRPFAREASHLHIDAVTQALTMKRSIPPPELDDPAPALGVATTTPDVKRSSGPSSRPTEQAPVTAMTSATGSRAREPKTSNKKAAFGLVAVALAVALVAFALTRPPAPMVASSPPPAASSVASSPPPVASLVASSPLPVVSSPSAAAPPPAPSAAAPPASVVAERPRAPFNAGIVKTTPRPPAAPSSAPAAPAAPAKPPSPGSLIEDRK